MKRLLPMLVGLFISFAFFGTSQQKTHFDNKPHVEGEMLVKILNGTSLKTLLLRAPSDYQLEMIKELSHPMDIWLVSFDDEAITHEGIQAWLYNQPEVAVADYNYYVTMRATTPGDPSFTQQWHHVNTGAGGGTADADIDSDEAWDITTGGTTATGHDIVVCLIEGGGGNLDHQDLDGNRWVNTGEIDGNSIDDDGNGYIDDYNGWNTGSNDDDYGNSGHGTNCLGMIGAKGDNGIDVVGANWDVKLMVMNMGGSLTQANVVAAYTYPLVMRQRWNNSGGADGAFVVATSASWGIDGADPTAYPIWCDFYDTLGAYGILNVGATTNSNLNVDVAGDMPTACGSDYMIGVGRTDNNDATAGGYGVTTIELGAPGIDVVTTNGTAFGASGTTTTTGTSFSCPLTAGVIGLAYSIPCVDFMNAVMANPQAGADLVLQALLDGTDPKAALASKFVTGGRLNSFNTLNELMTVACSGTICLAPGSISTTNLTGTSADITFTANASATATNFYWRVVGAPTWTMISAVSSPVLLTGLSGCTDYEYYMQTDCGGVLSNASSTKTFTTPGCGSCVDLPYCTNNATDGVDEWIESFVIDTYTNSSGNDGGFGDYTGSASIPLEVNTTYNFDVDVEWGGTLYDEQTRIWLDLNQDGTFDASELVFDQGTPTQTDVTGTINVPASATLGSTRLRVQTAYVGGTTTLPSECGSFTWGEVEDYCVNLIAEGSTSLNELTGGTVIAYPNPTNGVVNFKIENISATSIEIVDLVGKVVTAASVTGTFTQINLENFTQGSYFYRLIDTKGTVLVTEKLVLSK
ncbi:MAG: hypothetical protein ACI865_001006 [Flavobacteriaceae bacterium]|jgi:hypothetical protein